MNDEKMYLELTFSGDYKKILEFMEGKEWKYMQKRVSPNGETINRLAFLLPGAQGRHQKMA